MANKLKMDDVTRRRLQGINPFNIDAKIEFTPQVYKVKDERNGKGKGKNNPVLYAIEKKYWPVFLIRPLNPTEKLECGKIVDQMTGKDSADIVSDEELLEWARKVLVGWKNLIDIATMEPIKFEPDPSGGAKQNLVQSIPAHIQTAIVLFVFNLSGVTFLPQLGLD